MKKFLRGWAGGLGLGTLVFLLVGCGSGGQEQTPAVEVASLNGAVYGVLKDDGLTRASDSVSGSGTIIFKDPLPNPETNNFVLKFSLEEGGTLALVPHAEVGLKSAVEVVFGRKNNKLTVTLVEGKTQSPLEGDFNQPISAKGTIELDMDIHAHDVGDGHLIIWAGGEKQPFAFSSELTGRFWGLKLSNANVTHASVVKAKEEEN